MRRLIHTLLIGACLVCLPFVAAAEEPQGLDEAQLGQILETYVRSNAAVPPSAVEMPELQRFARADIDEFDVAVSSAPSQKMEGVVPLEIEVSSKGEMLEKGVVNVRVDAAQMVVVTRRALRMGTVLTDSDVTLEPRPESELPRDVLHETAQSIGRRLRQSLAAGRPLVAGHIEPLPAVRRGQRVKLELIHGRLRIESFGRAQQDGRPGDWVRVRNPSTNRDVTGRVASDGVVHVDL